MLSLVSVAKIHIRPNKGLKVTFVLLVVLILTPWINFALLPELYKQTFFPSSEVNSCNLFYLILVSCTLITARRNL